MKRYLLLSTLLLSAIASATPPASEAEAVLSEDLLKPLKVVDEHQARMSRALLPPQARRVRILDAQPHKDGEGREFVAFTMDIRSGLGKKDDERAWRKDVFQGCVYPATREIFVKRGEGYRAARILLGKKTEAAPKHVCQG